MGEEDHNALLRADIKDRESLLAAETTSPQWQVFFEHLEAQILKASDFLSKLNANLEADLSSVREKKHNWSNSSEPSLAIVLENLSRIGQEIIEIVKFMELNLTAIRKILKKFDKKFKGAMDIPDA